uniref:Uncharacterized protein n=1 Tax=Crocodylus porosus TaxID=8502 RepID=A0A7M4FUU3_CROPO
IVFQLCNSFHLFLQWRLYFWAGIENYLCCPLYIPSARGCYLQLLFLPYTAAQASQMILDVVCPGPCYALTLSFTSEAPCCPLSLRGSSLPPLTLGLGSMQPQKAEPSLMPGSPHYRGAPMRPPPTPHSLTRSSG